VVVQVMATPCLIEAAARTPERAAVLPALEVFDRWAGATANPGRRALSARCHALLAPPGSAAAEDGFREALRLHLANTFTAGESDFERARTDLLFGQELRRRRRPRDAREHLHRALETFQRFGARSWAERTAAELRATGEAVPAPAARVTVALTAQQRLIARLVAEGATNREVAAQLFLSPRTVDHHMRNIFSRLGIRSRIELAKLFPDSPACPLRRTPS
jgi:DNA-binding CsgD family transcriptional regulator